MAELQEVFLASIFPPYFSKRHPLEYGEFAMGIKKSSVLSQRRANKFVVTGEENGMMKQYNRRRSQYNCNDESIFFWGVSIHSKSSLFTFYCARKIL
jgi:hypothetical protein